MLIPPTVGISVTLRLSFHSSEYTHGVQRSSEGIENSRVAEWVEQGAASLPGSELENFGAELLQQALTPTAPQTTDQICLAEVATIVQLRKGLIRRLSDLGCEY